MLKNIFLPTGGFVRRLVIISLLVAGTLVGGLIIQSAVIRNVYFNFYETVGPGMYRSAQLSPQELGRVIRRYKIKTVVNLRAGADQPWFAAERAVINANRAKLIYLPLTASAYPDPKELAKLLKVVERIEPPFLVHCNGGADRTGLFFVLLALREGQSWSQAMGQLSLLRFGYCRLARSAAITYPLYDFDKYANQHGWTRDLEHFEQWLKADQARQYN